MVTTRLNDSQKQELVASYRRGESTHCLAEKFGCSLNTIYKIVKVALDSDDYEILKQTESTIMSVKLQQQKGKKANQNAKTNDISIEISDDFQIEDNKRRHNVHKSLAIEDADDFIDENDIICEDIENEDFNSKNINFINDYDMLIDENLIHQTEDTYSLIAQPIMRAPFPSNIYLLVDKNMELQSKLLREFSKFSNLPEKDGNRQALIIFGDLRQAKRLCGRTQRVIKLPDPSLLQRTASYLLARGITRVLLDGNLYSLD